ncbi:MAG: ABC transporter substrate-binding protein [Flavobacteriales bacterium]
MKRFYLLYIILSSLIHSCSLNDSRIIKGGKAVYGDTVNLSIPEPIQTLHPLYNSDLYAHRILGNIFEPLFDLDEKSNEIVPRVAESFLWKKDQTVLRIYLRKGIQFHKDQCFDGQNTELSATDVKFTLEMACSQNDINQSNDALIGKIKGADVFFKRNDVHSIPGIRIVNSHCLDIELNGKYAHFPQLLTSSKYGICSKIAYDFYKDKIIYHPIGTGPFLLQKNTQKQVLLSYNPSYWKQDSYGNTLPYLNALNFNVLSSEKQEAQSFKNEQLDILSEVSPQHIDDILFDLNTVQRRKPFAHKVIVIPGSRVSMIVLNQHYECFKDPRIRKAIDLVIDREIIANELMNGDGIAAKQGFAPPSSYYNNKELPIKPVDIILAKQLFRAAGYGPNHPFPEIDLYLGGNNSEQARVYCQYIANQLSNVLGIKTTIHEVDLAARYKAVVSNKAAIWKLGWSPDYPDPEAYFSLFYSKNPTNKNQNPLFPKVNSAIYDFNFSMGMEESDNGLRNNYFTTCDLILQDEHWVLPILYEDFVLVSNLKVREIKVSQIGLFDFTETYIKPL